VCCDRWWLPAEADSAAKFPRGRGKRVASLPYVPGRGKVQSRVFCDLWSPTPGKLSAASPSTRQSVRVRGARCCKSTVVFSTRWVGGWVGDHPTRVYNSAARRLGSGAEGTEEGGTNNGTPSTRSDGDGVVSVTPTPHAPPSDRHTRCSIRARVRGNPLSPHGG
jgi:hypothetical protein